MITLLALGIKKKIFSMVLHASRIHVTSAQLPFGSSTRREEKVAKLEGIGDGGGAAQILFQFSCTENLLNGEKLICFF